MPEPIEISHDLVEHHEHGGHESLKAISIAISVLAVLVAMVTVLGHRAHTEAVLMESRANDTWNEYQAKKIRMDNLSLTLDLFALEPINDPAAVQAKANEYKAHITKLQSDMAEEQKQAREYEAEVSRAEAKAAHYDLGEALLQIAVVLSSITLFTRRRTYFLLGITIGIVGLIITAFGLLVR